jgi:hypothetical protein
MFVLCPSAGTGAGGLHVELCVPNENHRAYSAVPTQLYNKPTFFESKHNLTNKVSDNFFLPIFYDLNCYKSAWEKKEAGRVYDILIIHLR